MWEEGLENFTFQVVEFCGKDRLTEREKILYFYVSIKKIMDIILKFSFLKELRRGMPRRLLLFKKC